MATIAIQLAIVGGSMALQYLMRPRVKQEPVDKGKLDDIRITGSEYGTFIPRVKGKARVGGNIIWSDGVTHTVVNTPSGGGKGVPQAPATRTHTYTTSLGIYICRGTVSRVLRTWADADLLLNNVETTSSGFEAEDGTRSGGASISTSGTYSGTGWVTNLGNGGKLVFDLSSLPNPTTPTPDPDEIATPYTRVDFFYKSSTARTATVTTNVTSATTVSFAATGTDWTVQTYQLQGFANSLDFENAGAAAPDLDYITVEKFWVIEPLNNPQTFKTPTYTITGAINPDIVYPLDIDDPSGYYNYPLTADANGKIALTQSAATTRYYTGSSSQTQDAAIISWLDARYGSGEGVLRAPAHRNIAYVVFEDRVLRQARVENFTFEVDCGSATVNAVLTDLFGDVNLTGSDYLLTATNGLTFTGWVEHTQASRRQLIEQLERYFFFRIAEIDGKITTVADTFTSAATISADLLRAHTYGEEMPGFDGELMIKEESLMPREVRVSVMNPDIEYHNETVVAALFASIDATESLEYSFPLVDTPANARLVAEKLLLKAHTEDRAVEFWGMPEMAKYAVGDVITVPLDGQSVKVRIEKKQVTLPLGKIRFQGITVSPFSPSYYQDDFTAAAPLRLQQFVTFNFPRNSIVVAIPGKPVLARDRGKCGVYLAPCGRGRGASENIAVYRQFDTDNYVLQFIADTPALVGLCAGTLANHGGGTATEDTVNTLDIWFFDDVTLESVTQPDIDAYPTLNLLRVGDEWLQFRTATAQTLEANSPYRSKWRVSNLWRGKFDTSAKISTHTSGEYATLFTNAVRWFDLDDIDDGTTVTLKAVTNGQAEANGQVTSFTFNKYTQYAVTNGATDRAFDANATSINELADVVATMIDDLNL